MGMASAILGVIGNVLPGITKSIFPDPADELKRMELEQRLTLALMEKESELQKAAAGIIQQEAASSHWLAANWRPLTMLIFVALIVARWLGFAADGMTEAEYLSVYNLMEIGLGGYVIGRSAEKVAPMIADAVKKGKEK